MRLVCISDTHGQHRNLRLPAGDLLIHAGDFSQRGEAHQVRDFLDWFADQPHRYKVLIGGNHDFFLEKQPQAFAALIPENCVYLNDSLAEIEGIRFWGSPVTPFFFNWAFNRHRGPDIRQHWDLIPDAVDVLITHGPPYGQLDRTVRGDSVGCQDLLAKVKQVRPRLGVFGHIHEGYGQSRHEDTLFLNASVVDERYRLVNPPVVIDYETLRVRAPQ